MIPPRWINYHPISKAPINAHTGVGIDLLNKAQWMTYDEAAANGSTGFVIIDTDPYFFLDIDHALQSDGTWSPLANELVALFTGAYVEVSMSGAGLHIIGTCVKPLIHSCKNSQLGIELYTGGRYCAVTGTGAVGSFETDCTPVLNAVIDKYFKVNGTEYSGELPSSGPVDEWNGYEDDDELIKAACASQSIFGNGASFKDLWGGNTAALGQAYPDTFGGDRPYDASSADSALAQHLAFWTGNDSSRIERLMRASGLVRNKWDDHRTYLSRTISKACGRQTKWHSKGRGQAIADTTELRAGHQFMSADQQLDHFARCVYVCDSHKVLVPWGDMLKPDQFRAMFGGYIFGLDAMNNKSTVNAWTAFTESQAIRFPKAHRRCFRPLGRTGEIEVQDDGTSLVNTWRDPKVRRVQGDVTPFLVHIAKLLPIRDDQNTLLRYMAAVVQYQGTKFQWAPLIQGAPGNGKTLFSRCVSYAVGKQYSFFPRAKELAERFNDWLVDRVFIGVEDVYFPSKKLDAIETLKPMVTATGEGYEVEPKGGQKFMYELVCNFILNTNHKDAIRKEEDDRRWAIFYTAQQSRADMVRDGMNGRYFPELYGWLRKDGYAMVAEYLWTYPIPAGWVEQVACYRAPTTSSTAEAVSLSLGGVEQEILEAVESGRRGFCGGWISSIALDKLLDDHKSARRVPRNRRRKVLQSLGYDWHPALTDGRSPRVTTVDGGKPRLFVKLANTELLSVVDVVGAYEHSQNVGR